ncbi:hypothetical protein H4R19_001522 [Coemansia spiralis]|nr:hypothetical protein H4R19_001522 [Coemansia spiralis]
MIAAQQRFRYGDQCKFAHGLCEQRARLRHPKYKTSLCKDYTLGACTFGSRCNFAHSLDELRAPLPDSPATADSLHFQLQPMLVQTPVGVLPDGRTMSTFTPLPAGADPACVQGDVRLLRRYQSAGALRVPDASAAPAPAVPVAAAAASPRWRAPQLPAYHSPSDGMSSAFALPAQPLLHLYRAHGSIARRVASLSQLPSLHRSAGPLAASSVHGAAATGPVHTPSSPLVYESPILAPPSPGEPDTASAHMLHDPARPTDDWLSEQSLWSAPRRTLTSSISMQALPRLNAPSVSPPSPGGLRAAIFERAVQDPVFAPEARASLQHPRGPAGRVLTSSTSMQALPRLTGLGAWDAPATPTGPMCPQLLHMASAQSSATLIDSDVWSTNGTKPYDSRFFPSDAALLRAPPAQPFVSRRGLRRQQSTDDWVLLQSSDAHPPSHLGFPGGLAPSNIFH